MNARIKFILISFSALIFTSCGGPKAGGAAGSCSSLSGTPYVPNVAEEASINHDMSVVVAKSTYQVQASLIGAAEGAPTSREAVVSIPMQNDLGAGGSITLVANATSLTGAKGGAVAYLVSLMDSAGNDYIHLARGGTGGDCVQAGYYSGSGSSLNPNPNCALSAPSAYVTFAQYEEHQLTSVTGQFDGNSPSVNTFPTCNWTGGTPGSTTDPECAFNSKFFVGTPARLRFGPTETLTAHYALLSDSLMVAPSGSQATLKLTVVKKTDTRSSGGSLDLNLILVGNRNIQASRNSKGRQNLDTILNSIDAIYNQPNSQIRLGKINVIEWPCSNGGEGYANLNSAEVGTMLSTGTSLLDPSTEGKALNVFLISSFTDGNGIIGFSAAINGPPLNGTPLSGATFATANKLDTYNKACAKDQTTCPLLEQDEDFFQLAGGIAHEMGHFLGLNHPSEGDPTLRQNDPVLDTPVCTTPDPSYSFGGRSVISNYSCSKDNYVSAVTGQSCASVCPSYPTNLQNPVGSLCPAQIECQFNHIMWWTNKLLVNGISDGEIFTPQSSGIIHYHPLIQ